VAALACEIAGPDRVSAFTVEYRHPGHPSEAPYAAQVCEALGMAPPRVVPISAEDVLASVPEGVWLTEDPRYWKRTYPMTLARAAAAEGFDRFLTGFGVGSHMGYLEEFARAAPAIRLAPGGLGLWASGHKPFPGGRTALSALHPGFDAPMKRLLYPIAAALRSRGERNTAALFPPELTGAFETLLESPRVQAAAAAGARLPLGRQLQRLAYLAMNSCVDVARCERVARMVGAHWLGPAHFPGSLPYVYLAPRPAGALWSARRRARAGKFLVSAAMRGVLPDAIIDRPKYWPHANGPAEWRDRSLARMDAAAGASWEELRSIFGASFDAARRYCPEGMIPLAFWHRVCVSGGWSRAPGWQELS
jgi:asparagine synthetase B (glutamine-hydrolysing)